MFGEIANQSQQQSVFAPPTVAHNIQGSMVGSGQQGLFGTSGPSTFGQGGGGSMFAIGQQQGGFDALAGSGGGNVFGSQQPYSGTSSQ